MIRVHTVHLPLANAYILENERSLALVDCGSPFGENKLLRSLEAFVPKKLESIFITHAHFDHYGNARVLSKRYGAKVFIHGEDAEALQRGESPLGSVRGRGQWVSILASLFSPLEGFFGVCADVLMADGTALGAYGWDVQVLHTPGHTPGSSSLLVGGKTVFVGDLLSTHKGPHVQRYFASDWSQLWSSLNRLKDFNFELLYVGHGKRPMKVGEFTQLLNSKVNYNPGQVL